MEPETVIATTREDAEYKVLWDRLSKEEKDALFDLIKLMGDTSKMRSLRELLRVQSEISLLITTKGHFGFIWRSIVKVGAAAGIIVGLASAWRVFFEK